MSSEEFQPETVNWETQHKPGFVALVIAGEMHVLDCGEAYQLAEAIQHSAELAEKEMLEADGG